jgi:hypothetical protein
VGCRKGQTGGSNKYFEGARASLGGGDGDLVGKEGMGGEGSSRLIKGPGYFIRRGGTLCPLSLSEGVLWEYFSPTLRPGRRRPGWGGAVTPPCIKEIRERRPPGEFKLSFLGKTPRISARVHREKLFLPLVLI